MKNKIFKILIYSIGTFIFLNIFLAIMWPIINDFRMNNKTYYDQKILKIIGIDRDEELTFYKEMWNDRKFKYLQFAGQYENETFNQKYFNVTKNNGRKIINKKNCTKRFFFYGSSQTFGYNVKDNQTIPAYFKEILNKNYPDKIFCVYNFGSASHFSTQETVFFQTHILKKKIKRDDFIFFLDGFAEDGNRETRVDRLLNKMFQVTNYKYWNKYKFTFPQFFESLPLVQLYKRIMQKIRLENSNLDAKGEISENEKLSKQDEIFHVFQNNVNFRKAICNELNLNCFTFLIPYPLLSGVYEKNIFKRDNLELDKQQNLELYQLLKNTEGIIDINNALDNETELSYIDHGHFSPKASLAIAKKIYLNIEKNLN